MAARVSNNETNSQLTRVAGVHSDEHCAGLEVDLGVLKDEALQLGLGRGVADWLKSQITASQVESCQEGARVVSCTKACAFTWLLEHRGRHL